MHLPRADPSRSLTLRTLERMSIIVCRSRIQNLYLRRGVVVSVIISVKRRMVSLIDPEKIYKVLILGLALPLSFSLSLPSLERFRSDLRLHFGMRHHPWVLPSTITYIVRLDVSTTKTNVIRLLGFLKRYKSGECSVSEVDTENDTGLFGWEQETKGSIYNLFRLSCFIERDGWGVG